MNALVKVQEHLPATAAEVRDQVNRIQEIMEAVMKDDVHYGIIPGTKKKTLYKPGAEVLAATFHIAVKFEVDDLSQSDSIRYRIRAIGVHQSTGIVLGEGLGECSSAEEKFAWRRAICDEEFDLAVETMRRVKFSKYQGNVEKTKQLRTVPADAANTILKMAAKRAQVALILNVLAASDIFAQDIEDLPEHLVEATAGETKQPVQQPQGKSEKAKAPASKENKPVVMASAGQIKMIQTKLGQQDQLDESALLKEFGVQALQGITVDVGNSMLERLNKILSDE